jgi:hypothetical protein
VWFSKRIKALGALIYALETTFLQDTPNEKKHRVRVRLLHMEDVSPQDGRQEMFHWFLDIKEHGM